MYTLSFSEMLASLAFTWHREEFSVGASVDASAEDEDFEEDSEDKEDSEDQDSDDEEEEDSLPQPNPVFGTIVNHVFPDRDSRSGIEVSEVFVERYAQNLLQKPYKKLKKLEWNTDRIASQNKKRGRMVASNQGGRSLQK